MELAWTQANKKHFKKRSSIKRLQKKVDNQRNEDRDRWRKNGVHWF